MLSKKLSALVAISMLTASSAAVAQTAQPLSLANSPALHSGGAMSDASALDSRNGIGIYLIGAVVLGLIIWGVIELTKSDEGESSP
jgi:NADH:ubiquinone oxidoreductase subunit 2 (subunit N)